MPKFERDVEIDAPVEKVWEVLTNPSYWPQWFPGVDSVGAAQSLSAGQKIDWVSKGQTGQATITKMEPMKRLEVMTQLGDDRDSHVFVLHPSGGFFGMKADECKVEYTLDTLMGGGILGSFVAGGNPMDAMRVKKATVLLRKLVESL
jgi:uncharacterized protein YndB with AHSA1/START domain